MNVLLIDDHPMINSGLSTVLEETGKFSICGKANTLAAAKSFINNAASKKATSNEATSQEATMPSLVILDILLNEENGLDFLPFLEEICKKNKIPKPPVLVCSVLEEPFRIQNALELGASGYLPKTGGKEELLDAIAAVIRGEIYISKEHSAKVMNTYGLYEKFTKRELDIINLVKKNRTNKQISLELGINIRTVENHMSNLYFKTGVLNRQELMEL